MQMQARLDRSPEGRLPADVLARLAEVERRLGDGVRAADALRQTVESYAARKPEYRHEDVAVAATLAVEAAAQGDRGAMGPAVRSC